MHDTKQLRSFGLIAEVSLPSWEYGQPCGRHSHGCGACCWAGGSWPWRSSCRAVYRLWMTKGMHMGEFIVELWAFMKERKKFWLLPIIVVLLLFGSLVVLTQGTVVAPFIYTLF